MLPLLRCCATLVARYLKLDLKMAHVKNCNLKKLAPCKESYRLDEVTAKKIDDIAELGGVNKSDVARTFFNFALDYFYDQDGTLPITDEQINRLYTHSMVNEKALKLSEPINAKITKIQVYYMKQTSIFKSLTLPQCIRLFFHIGADSFDRLYEFKLNEIKAGSGGEILSMDKFNTARDIVQLNCWDKQ